MTEHPKQHPWPKSEAESPQSPHLEATPPTSPSQEEKKQSPRGTAAMDQATRKEVARKGGLAVSRNREHMAEIGRKGGQAVSKNREHMAKIGRKGGAASRGSTKTSEGSGESEGSST